MTVMSEGGREARVAPRDGCLKDTRDFAKESSDRSRDRKEPEYREVRSEPPKEKPMEPDKNLFREVVNNVLGTTEGACLKNVEALEKGGDLAKQLTVGVCAAAGLQGFTNTPANIGCGVALGVSAATDAASDAWKNHCGTLPLTITPKPN